MRPTGRRLRPEARLCLVFFAVAGVITLATALFGCTSNKTFTMPNHSMAPTIEKGERVKVDMKAYEIGDPEAGDLAMFIPNENRDLRWIFRVAAVPGDVLSYSDGTLEKNGISIHAPPPLQDQAFKSPERMKEGYVINFPYTLEEAEYFFLSDDPDHLHDSRYWGIVGRDQITGKLISHN